MVSDTAGFLYAVVLIVAFTAAVLIDVELCLFSFTGKKSYFDISVCVYFCL